MSIGCVDSMLSDFGKYLKMETIWNVNHCRSAKWVTVVLAAGHALEVGQARVGGGL